MMPPCPRLLAPLTTAAMLALVLLSSTSQHGSLSAQDLSATKVLPDTTVAMLRIPDTAELGEQFNESALGQMMNDEQVQPVIEHLYGSVTPQIVELQDQLGVSLEDLSDLAIREVTLGLVDVSGGRPALVALIEMDEPKALDDLLERAKEALVNGGFSVSNERIEGVDATVFSRSTVQDLRKRVMMKTTLVRAGIRYWMWKPFRSPIMMTMPLELQRTTCSGT